MKLLALKIDVDSIAAARAVPRLHEILAARNAGATFFWSMGRERYGRFLRPGSKMRRLDGGPKMGLRARYGLKRLMLGGVLPARALAGEVLRALNMVKGEKYEHAVRPVCCYDWQQAIKACSAAEAANMVSESYELFAGLVGNRPVAFGAAGWQVSRAALRQEGLLALEFSSDTRGGEPFWPVVEGEPVPCLQLPVTLPMLEELLPVEGEESAMQRLTKPTGRWLEIYNASADFEGGAKLELFARLLDAWVAEGWEIVALGEVLNRINPASAPHHEIEWGEVPGRNGLLARQGKKFPA